MSDPTLIQREQAVAFAPCHVSAFFVPHIVPREPARTGSIGAGICLAAGVAAEVTVDTADAPAVTVQRTHAEGPTQVTQAALGTLLNGRPVEVTCRLQEGAPVGQGFGVSGASSLAAAFALARCLGEGRSDALKAAHLAEVRQRTGLGDVVASFLGSAVMRSQPGLPPYGATRRLPMQGEVVVATVGDQIDTSQVLSDQGTLETITEAGTKAMEQVTQRPSPEVIFQAGAWFDRETGLVDAQTLRAIEACAEGGVAMAAMLGNTVVAYGETDVLVDVLQGFGQPHVLPVDQGGLRTLEALPEVPS